MSKYMKAILTAIALLLASSVTAQEKPLAEEIEDCESKVRGLSAISETMDRMDGNASEEVQKAFVNYLDSINSCATELTKRTGKKYKVTKDWFGSGYTLKKP